MKFGYFDDANKEYVITSPRTPYPWINYLGTQDFFSLFTLMLNYVAMQVVTYCIVFWENPKGSNTVGIINQATKGGWLPELFGQKYGWNVVIVLILTVGMFIYLKFSIWCLPVYMR